jgi:predicted nucleic acid-binding protein
MTETEDETLKSIIDLYDENWKQFPNMAKITDQVLDETIRKMPVEIITQLRQFILQGFLGTMSGHEFKFKLIIDTNVVVSDSIRVAKGKKSSTLHFLSSPFLSLMAPREIESEVIEKLNEKFKNDEKKLIIAKTHAKNILKCIKIVGNISGTAIQEARRLIADRDEDDIPFLALALESSADAILSYDKEAFDDLPNFQRLDVGPTTKLVLKYERGTFSFVIVGGSLEMLLPIFRDIIFWIFRCVISALETLIQIFGNIISGAIETLSKLPPWVFIIIGGVLICFMIAVILDDDFRDGIKDILNDALEILQPIIDAIKEVAMVIWNGLKAAISFVLSLITDVAPMFVGIAAVLILRAKEFVDLIGKDKNVSFNINDLDLDKINKSRA